jgi:uncharacterized membrane protein YgdD (TMEM256/DUF423 family)
MLSLPRPKTLWVTGSLLLALAVIIGAFGAHGLKALVTAERLVTFETGVRYHFYHAFGILFLAAFAQLNPGVKIQASFWAFVVGILVFSFNCYLYVLTDIKVFAMVVPLGGVSFIIGWIALAVCAKKSELR